MLLAQRPAGAGKERVGHALLARRADEAVRVPGRVERIDDLALDDLLAIGAHCRERRQEALGAVGKVVLALLDLAAVAEIFAARVARQVVRMPGHAKRLEHNVVDFLSNAFVAHTFVRGQPHVTNDRRGQ